MNKLVVVISVIYNSKSIVKDVKTVDPRYEVFRGVVLELRRLGHRVFTLPADPGKRDWKKIRDLYDEDGPYDPKRHGRPDCAIMWWAYHGPHPPPSDVPTLFYENGFAKGDVVVDPGGLLGSSFYKDTLNDLVQSSVDPETCDAFVAERLSSGSWSKRPQQQQESSLGEEEEGYVFVPTQKLSDLSIEKYSNTSMVELLRKTARFCGVHGLSLVVKIHPHVQDTEHARQANVVTGILRKKFTPNITLSNASIGDLARRARFTVCLNGGTIVDNAYTQTPVLTTAPSMFMHTDAVVYAPDVKQGLEEMRELTEEAWPESRKLRQRQLVCWIEKNSLNARKSALLNIETLQRHFDAKYPEQISFF